MKLSDFLIKENRAEKGLAPFTHGPLHIPDDAKFVEKLRTAKIDYYVTYDYDAPKSMQNPILFFTKEADLKTAQGMFKSELN